MLGDCLLKQRYKKIDLTLVNGIQCPIAITMDSRVVKS